MTGQRLFGFAVLLSLSTACFPAVNQSLAPQMGPRARIHASFAGGITNRDARARFSVESDAYVMVGHLGGDGFVRILYPSAPTQRAVVQKGQTYTTADVSAVHDALPALYQAHTPRYRHISARLDSYDGAGNGYFFLIASRYPLHFGEIGIGDEFDVIEVPDYYSTYDPRLTIKALADLVSRGSPYTLEFASSFSTFDYSNSFDHRQDCLALSMVSFGSFASPYGYLTDYFFASPSTRSAIGCASQYAYSFFQPRYSYATYTPPSTVTPTIPPRDSTPAPSVRHGSGA